MQILQEIGGPDEVGCCKSFGEATYRRHQQIGSLAMAVPWSPAWLSE
jgi:hypothetical protein